MFTGLESTTNTLANTTADAAAPRAGRSLHRSPAGWLATLAVGTAMLLWAPLTGSAFGVKTTPRIHPHTQRVSVGPLGAEANGNSRSPTISDSGDRVAFESDAGNLIFGDQNDSRDIFGRGIAAGMTEIASTSSRGRGGVQADGMSALASISATGRYVVFASLAGNLVEGDTNNEWDIFVHDSKTGSTSRVSVGEDGMVQSDGRSLFASVSTDGRYVAFSSGASNLVSRDTNGKSDVFVVRGPDR